MLVSGRRVSTVGSLAVVICMCGATVARAQDAPTLPASADPAAVGAPRTAPGFKKLLKDAVGDFRRLPNDKTLGLLLVGASFAGAAHSVDQSLTNRLTSTTANTDMFVPGNIMGGAQFQVGAAFATYTVGRLTGKTRVAEVGAHLIRAQIVAQATTQAVKHSVKRMRPDGSTRNSFPSGHTSVSFASATVLHREFGWKVGIPAYAVASYIGFSRIEHKRHYLSDVLFGAAIGMVSGRAIGINVGQKRFNMTPVAAPGGGGVAFVWDGR